jgi:hypothetical protein
MYGIYLCFNSKVVQKDVISLDESTNLWYKDCYAIIYTIMIFDWFLVFKCQYFSYIMATSCSGGRSRSTRGEPPTMGKQLVEFIAYGCESSAPFLEACMSCIEPPVPSKYNISVRGDYYVIYKLTVISIIQHYLIKFVSDLWQVGGFLPTSSFLQLKWTPQYNWNIVVSGIKHQNP